MRFATEVQARYEYSKQRHLRDSTYHWVTILLSKVDRGLPGSCHLLAHHTYVVSYDTENGSGRMKLVPCNSVGRVDPIPNRQQVAPDRSELIADTLNVVFNASSCVLQQASHRLNLASHRRYVASEGCDTLMKRLNVGSNIFNSGALLLAKEQTLMAAPQYQRAFQPLQMFTPL